MVDARQAKSAHSSQVQCRQGFGGEDGVLTVGRLPFGRLGLPLGNQDCTAEFAVGHSDGRRSIELLSRTPVQMQQGTNADDGRLPHEPDVWGLSQEQAKLGHRLSSHHAGLDRPESLLRVTAMTHQPTSFPPVSLPPGVKQPPAMPVDSSTVSGGYNIEFVKSLDEKHMCPICLLPLHDPMQTGCGHRFCRTCIQRITGLKQPKCPVDEEKVEEIYPDSFCKKEMMSMDVRCPNQCKWIGPLGDLQDHSLSCPGMDIIDCPHRCGDRCARKEISVHLRFHCTLATDHCDFYIFGCPFQGRRAALKDHIEAAEKNHIQLVTDWVSERSPALFESQKSHGLSSIVNKGKVDPDKFKSIALDAEDPLLLEISTLVGSEDTATWCAVNLLHGEPISGLNFLESLETMNCSISWKQALHRTLRAWIHAKANEATGVQLYNALISAGRYDIALRFRQDLLQEQDIGTDGAAGARDKDLLAVQEKNTELLQEKISALGSEVSAWNSIIGRTDAIIADFDLRLMSQERTSFNGTLIWKIPEYRRRYEEAHTGKKPSLYSPSFFTSRHGYKIGARLYLNGDKDREGTHLSVFFVLMKGEYDALLPWPFQQRVTFTLFDQSAARQHISDSFLPDPASSSFQRPISTINIASGSPKFATLSLVNSERSDYVKDNTMFISIAVDTTNLPGDM